MSALDSLWRFVDGIGRGILNVPRDGNGHECGSDDCEQCRPLDLHGEDLDFEQWFQDREFGNPVG